jgi:hypothetical protein
MGYMYLGYILINLGKCKEELWDGIEQNWKEEEYSIEYTGLNVFN